MTAGALVAASAALAPPSDALRTALADQADGYGTAPPAALAAEVDARIAALNAACVAATAAEWGAFLAPLFAVAERAPPSDALPVWLNVAAGALADIPRALLTRQRAMAAAAAFAYWPAPARLAKWLRDDARRLTGELAALRRLQRRLGAPDAAPAAPGPVDLAHVRRQRDDAVAFLDARAAALAPPVPPPAPAHLPGPVLAAHYARAAAAKGGAQPPALAARLAHLRRGAPG